MFKILPLTAITLLSVYCSRDLKVAGGEVNPDYKKYCAGCHGERAEWFLKREWKYGNSRLDIARAIRLGYPEGGMPGFAASMTEDKIMAVADYVVRTMEQQKDQVILAEALTSATFTSEGMTLRLDTVLSGLESPWGMVFLPNGDLIFTEKGGSLWRLDKNRKKTEIKGVPRVSSDGQGGLLDVELHPKFAENNTLYLSYSKIKEENGAQSFTTAVYKAQLEGDQLRNGKDIFVALPYATTKHHYGSRMEFGRDGYLYVTVGERGKQDDFPQFLDKGLGKIHRITDEGGIPSGNPFTGQSGAVASIWSYGHRNPQGLAFHPATGVLWEHEHGPRGGDELNRIEPGKNYGWPLTSYGTHYDGRSFTDKTTMEGIEAPITYWVPSIAPCGMAFVTGNLYPGWKENLLVGSLRFRYLNRVVLEGNTVVKQENLLENIGRMRCVAMSPEGYIYLSVEEPGFIFRIKPIQ